MRASLVARWQLKRKVSLGSTWVVAMLKLANHAQ